MLFKNAVCKFFSVRQFTILIKSRDLRIVHSVSALADVSESHIGFVFT